MSDGMQKSRKTLLQHGSIEKAVRPVVRRRSYTFSLSLMIVLWGVVFLWNLWISHSNVNRSNTETGEVILLNFSSWDEWRSKSNATRDSEGKTLLTNICINETVTVAETESASLVVGGRKGGEKTDRLTGLDEFKSGAHRCRSADVSTAATGGKYNHASAGKGAKVLDFNTEAKGASDILSKEKDKYLRNPCSAEAKFVVIELSEETLVDTIEIANYEHYSSNLRDFEVLGSLVYPTQTWIQLGNFSAANVKHAQTFTLSDPKWVRYLKLKFLTHFGSEFYCTLSSVQVYGVDAVERMLQDLISVPDNYYHSVGERKSDENVSNGSELATKTVPGDTVLKILMQKVRALDLSLNVLEGYMEDMDVRYGSNFKEFDRELKERDFVLLKIRSEMKNVLDNKDLIAKEVEDLMAWRSLVTKQLDGLVRDNTILRSETRKVLENQVYMESRGILAFVVSIIFGFLALVMLCKDVIFSICRSQNPRKFCRVKKSSWFFLVLSCSTTIAILSL